MNNSPNDLTGSSVPQKKKAADGHEYHVSSTANATVAPTNSHTIENASKAKGLSTDGAEFLTILDYEWNLLGKLDPEQIRIDYGIHHEDWDRHVNDPNFLQALKLRGIPSQGLNERVIDSGPVGSSTSPQPEPPKFTAKLTPIQLVVANTMLDLSDTRSRKKKLQDAGCTTTQYNAWMRDPNFRNYLQTRAEQIVGQDVQHEAMLALADRVMSGDMKAIEYYHELTGRFVRQTSSNSSGPDLQSTIVRIIEIIQDEVDDPDTAIRIASRLKGLITGTQIAHSLANPSEIVAPEIATARTLTPEVQELMNRGVGYDS